MSNAGIRKVLWWVCLVAAPAVLIGLELFHPAHFTADPGMFAFLSKPHAYDPHFVALGYSGPDAGSRCISFKRRSSHWSPSDCGCWPAR